MADNEIIVDTATRIVTPENIAFRYELAGPFRRFPAYLLDLAVRLMAIILIAIVSAFLGIALSSGFVLAIILVSLFILEWFYGGIFETYWNGQTPGKRMLGLRVLTVDGRPINGLQAVLRNILRAVDMMPLFPLAWFIEDLPMQLPLFLLGFLSTMWTQRFQRLGDIVCGTIVVAEERSWLFGISKVDDPRAAQLAEYIPANFVVSRKLSRALATYVERRKFFSPMRRREVAAHVANPLIERFGLPRDTSPDLMMCALYHRTFIVKDEQDRREAAIISQAENPFAGSGKR
jgi:uncharacterized RDD family membrane protein YckC